MSNQSVAAPDPPSPRERTLERRLFGWILALTLLPALVLLIAGGWSVATSLSLVGALGPWEEVAESGRTVVELASPIADPELADALAVHRAQLSASLTQARRWAFLGERLQQALPWLVLLVGLVLVGLAAAASRQLARQLARPINQLVVLAEHLGHGEPLPLASTGSVKEVRVLDTALRDAADRLAEAQRRAVAAARLRVWGEMARRVAHEMKNPLTPLRLAAHRLARTAATSPDQSGEGAPVAEVVAVIDQEVRRLEDLAAQFSALGRPPEGPPTEVDVGELLRALVDVDLPPDLSIDLDIDDDLPPALGRYDGLLRAFRNLVRNAVEAMEGMPDPRLRLTARQATDPDGGGRCIEVQISDSGPGLPSGMEDRVFEPDFTTKTRGTGLGLALVRQAVEADGGSITAANQNGGAEFRIRIPAVDDAATDRTEERE